MASTAQSPSIKQLTYFVAVAKHSNYRRAAEELGMSQPALTNQITLLESTLNTALFERSRAGTLLSPSGRDLLDAARQVLLSMKEFEDLAAAMSDSHQTTYRLGVPPTVGPYLLPHVLPDLHDLHINLKLYVREAAHRELQKDVLDGIHDIAIVPLPLTAPQLAMEPLFIEPLKFVVPVNHSLAGQKYLTPSKLRGEKILTLEEKHHFHHQVQEICERWGADLQRDYEGTSLDTLRQMVVMGMGVAFLPGLYVHSEMHDPKALYVCELRNFPVLRKHALVWRANAPNRTFYRELAADIRTIINNRLRYVISATR
ncbi:Hydrogen peroxide-inducible genes activator [Zhongshania aliphaticivorans]|uniref:Hydrogen peroxide-inducible genes activator n=1 Tax=Zhongshania aliphaticivorans TaxID=1470434 RepID=A0A5S9NCC3_9GAMM|nr:hydrogen peroxide-inducible genes activator [Zhongshania aliphaticivorans]CAA0087097.1 Hydrogen peroxide-inducible genes activator [Zhongshania aliphaticivorans]CAA0114054.1 Hydrogen peroxide-inducible genes activator [Zhongshania aliphaticivorans]